ncbi:peroxisome biogenesis protein 16-like [Tasmannia lanceolata]|uniref:peroxisome biogenesis protein 16-like n=1 Tax=Tasmannia lanceolata TaxID=3420 RepID=UPI00406339CB
MEAYKRWIRKNRKCVHSVESIANGMTWLLPECISGSEIKPEAVRAILGIITSVNQHIMNTDQANMKRDYREPLFPWSLFISALKDVENLVEVMAQEFYGDDSKWNFIAVTEATKALARLALFRDGGYKMLLNGGQLTNVEEGRDASESDQGIGSFAKPGGNHGCNPTHLEGKDLSAMSKFGENDNMVSDPTLEPPTMMIEKPTLSTIWSEKGLSGASFVTGEVLFILRPLIYVVFVRKYGVRSWIPWLLSLAVDLTGTGILSHVTNLGLSSRSIENPFPLSTFEKNEVKKRKLLLAFYLMRDPFFSKYTRHHLENTEKLVITVPLARFIAAKFVELIVGAQARYTNTSAS